MPRQLETKLLKNVSEPSELLYIFFSVCGSFYRQLQLVKQIRHGYVIKTEVKYRLYVY